MADQHTWEGTPTEAETELMAERMRLFIFPNQPDTEEQVEAFNKAVAWQIAHEKSRQESFDQIPDGVEGFKIGDFSMDFEEGVNSSGLTRKTICPAAYSVLLRAELLYRGLEGRCFPCP
jgi:hypothetical protein